MRKYFLDNIRWATVLAVLVYHVFYLYNAQGVAGGIGPFFDSQPWDVICTILYPWFMVLLFVVAGASARYALERQDPRAFLRSRTRKLLVPSTLGLLVYQYGVGVLNLKLGGGWDLIPAPVNYIVALCTAIGPLWFIQMLWLFSLLLAGLRKLPVCEKLLEAGARCPIWGLILLFLPVWGAAQILNTPVIVFYRFGIYGLGFLLGYFVLSHDRVQDALKQWHLPLLALAAVTGILYTVRFFGQNYCEDRVLRHILTNLYLWMMVLAVFGCGKAWFDRTSPFAAYMTRASFGIYVVHYLIAMLVCLGLKASPLPVALIYVLALALVLSLSPLVYEGVRRVPVLRYITLGIKKG